LTGRVEIVGDTVLKRLANADAAARLIARTKALIAAGVPTPEARPGPGPGVVRFERIRGEPGLSVVSGASDGLAALLEPLAALHGAEVPGLEAYDPLHRIRPRLAGGGEPWIDEWIGRHTTSGRPAGPVHGDFHAGQLVRDAGGRVWVLDLDDLALGSPEADLGNFAAHLATRPETRQGDPLPGFERWLTRVLRHRPVADRDLAASYGKIALLRRGLKLAEQGDASVLEALRRA